MYLIAYKVLYLCEVSLFQAGTTHRKVCMKKKKTAKGPGSITLHSAPISTILTGESSLSNTCS